MVQGTQCELVEGQGQVEVGASRLLGLPGLAVSRVDLQEGSRDRVVHMVTAADAAAACPTCGVVSTSSKGAAVTHPRDLPYGADGVRLVWHKRRWRCREALCERATFTESLPAVPPRARVSTGTNTYDLTADGQRVAIFYTKVHDHLLWPLIAADAPPAPPPLRAALRTIDRHIHAYTDQARLGTAA